jgi:hypothetical protein
VEYTERVIEYANKGLLMLSEGDTLPSYICKKLRCDLSRLSQKFPAGTFEGPGTRTDGNHWQRATLFMMAAQQVLETLERRFWAALEQSDDPSRTSGKAPSRTSGKAPGRTPPPTPTDM